MLRTASSLPLTGFDAGLRPGPLPGRAASLLPGLLATTRTGLPPAGEDELTNTKKHHGSTSRRRLLLSWAHERSGLSQRGPRFPYPAAAPRQRRMFSNSAHANIDLTAEWSSAKADRRGGSSRGISDRIDVGRLRGHVVRRAHTQVAAPVRHRPAAHRQV
jgi:hypothetical protein